jgi:DNA-directed RNA polymerase subunit beta'
MPESKLKVFLQIITWVLLPITNVVIDVWTSANAQLTELAMKTLEKTNKVSTQCMMLDSGARGSKEQIRQLTGMRGFG